MSLIQWSSKGNTYDNTFASHALSESNLQQFEDFGGIPRTKKKKDPLPEDLVSVCCEAPVRIEEYNGGKKYNVCTSCGKSFCGAKEKSDPTVSEYDQPPTMLNPSAFGQLVQLPNGTVTIAGSSSSVLVGRTNQMYVLPPGYVNQIITDGVIVHFEVKADHNTASYRLRAFSDRVTAEIQVTEDYLRYKGIEQAQRSIAQDIADQHLKTLNTPKKQPFWKKAKKDPFNPF